jgi:hypothetical protein
MVETSPDLLERVLNFIYEGEAYVTADLLENFMDVAEKLGIRGLHKEHSGEAVSRENSAKKRPSDAPVDLPRKRPCPDTTATRPVISPSPARLSESPVVASSSRTVRCH